MRKLQRPESVSLWSWILLASSSIGFSLLSWYWIEHPISWAASATLGLAQLFALATWRYCYLERAMRDERNERGRIKREYEREDLFQDGDDRVAGVLYESFLKWGVRIFAVKFGLEAVALTGFWLHHVSSHDLIPVQAPLPVAGFAGFCGIMALLAGSFLNGMSREPGFRWHRPIAQLTILAAGYMLVLAVAMVAELRERPEISQWLALLSLILLLIVAIELLISPILDFYRPRVPGQTVRPLYESRLLSFVTQPGTLAENISQALEYQFGLKLSDSWLYQLVARGLVPLVALGCVMLYVLDCFVGIAPHEVGIRETYWPGGTSQREIVGSGLHLKLPWPFQVIRPVPAHRLQQLDIALEEEDAHAENPMGEEDPYFDPTEGRVITWDKRHGKGERYFLLPSADISDNTSADTRVVPVTALQACIPIHFQVGTSEEDILAYAYNYADPHARIESICQREVVLFLASQTVDAVLREGRVLAAETLTARMRKALAEAQPPLGVKLVYVALTDLHPPAETGEAFQNVVGAAEIGRATILKATGDAQAWRNQAQAEAKETIVAANAYAAERALLPEARSDRFAHQRLAYSHAPGIYTRRMLMEVLRDSTQDVRRIFSASDDLQILEVDLHEKADVTILKDLKIE